MSSSELNLIKDDKLNLIVTGETTEGLKAFRLRIAPSASGGTLWKVSWRVRHHNGNWHRGTDLDFNWNGLSESVLGLLRAALEAVDEKAFKADSWEEVSDLEQDHTW